MKTTAEPIKVSIQTFGCQMNQYDTEVAEGVLERSGFEIAGPLRFPRSVERAPDADVIIMNTCSIRGHAEDRVFGRLGRLGVAKRSKPELIVGLMGCMVEEHKENLFKRYPQLDFLVGTRNIQDLPRLIGDVRRSRKQVASIKQDGISIEYTDLIKRKLDYHAWLPIMTGCNKICTYCVVPMTRGAEVSMPARDVYREASRLVAEGVQWITLLGQNVNSYVGAPLVGVLHSDSGSIPKTKSRAGIKPAPAVSFPQLLEMLCEIDGLEMISFTTSHPQDATEELFQVMARNPKISRRFHLPLQSGSDRMLKRMARLHTFAEYQRKIDRLRLLVPDVCLTTDMICGFSSETDTDHAETVAALRAIRYDSAFIYKYSLRPGTPAAKLPDDVAEEVKERRHGELLALQTELTRERNQSWIGRRVSVFGEKLSRWEADKVSGRTSHDKKVLFNGDQSNLGKFVRVQLRDLKNETFLGDVVHA